MSEQDPFGREEFLDKPGILGARWWQRSLAAADAGAGRRAVLGILVTGFVLSTVGVLAASGSASSSNGSGSGGDDYRTEARNALEMQKQFGWSFGATTESLTFDGTSKRPFAREALSKLAGDLRPTAAAHVPWYVPTLFESPSAVPRSTPTDDTTPPAALRDALQPIFTPAMDVAYRRGKALAALFMTEAPKAPKTPTTKAPQPTAPPRPRPVGGTVMVVVDLPGPESIAFAAGAATAFDPVFAIDNWPHPRGVVAAHRTLAAAAYYQPLFARRAATSGALPPMMVLDRRRLDPYTDDSSQFDNRHLARVPGAPALEALGITRVLYVAPTGADGELDDLNTTFVLYKKANLDVKLVGADAFGVDPGEAAPQSPGPDDDRPLYHYGGRAVSDGWFWHDYPWITPPPDAPGHPPEPPQVKLLGVTYQPVPRATPFSSFNVQFPGSVTRPFAFGTVPVVISVATGLVLGAKLFRSGSWNRSAGGWGG